MRASRERHAKASLFVVSFWAHFRNCFLRCLLPVARSILITREPPPGTSHRGPCSPGRSALLCPSSLNAGWCFVLLVWANVSPDGCGVALVKLVHHPSSRRGRHVLPGHCSRPIVSDHVEHEPVGIGAACESMCRRQVPAPPRDGSLCATCYIGRHTLFLALKLPSAPARDITYS